MKFRKAISEDAEILYEWANDPVTRSNSYNKNVIGFKDHVQWFNNKLADLNCELYIFLNDAEEKTGMVRIDVEGSDNSVIGINVAPEHRGKGLASQILIMACDHYLDIFPERTITAYIFKSNISSFKSFTKARFIPVKEETVKGIDSFILVKKNS